jgi:hypothetical protein
MRAIASAMTASMTIGRRLRAISAAPQSVLQAWRAAHEAVFTMVLRSAHDGDWRGEREQVHTTITLDCFYTLGS